jgi:pimeloyl-ACP methyl ester carboxylesterase
MKHLSQEMRRTAAKRITVGERSETCGQLPAARDQSRDAGIAHLNRVLSSSRQSPCSRRPRRHECWQRARSLDNDDLLAKLRKPVLIVHGDRDAVVKPAVVGQHTARLPNAEMAMMPDVGHTLFWDDAPAFTDARRHSANGSSSRPCRIRPIGLVDGQS